jgi:mRNA interferase HigB
MKVIGRKILFDFALSHADVRSQVQAWLALTEGANWRTPADAKEWDRDASLLESNCVVFNLKGNKYRLMVRIAYNTQVVFILRIGTHSEYSKW